LRLAPDLASSMICICAPISTRGRASMPATPMESSDCSATPGGTTI